MTKRELIEMLEGSDAPDDTLILLSSDEEGNSYREASLDTYLTKAYPDGYGWETVHADDLEAFDDTELTDVLVVW